VRVSNGQGCARKARSRLAVLVWVLNAHIHRSKFFRLSPLARQDTSIISLGQPNQAPASLPDHDADARFVVGSVFVGTDVPRQFETSHLPVPHLIFLVSFPQIPRQGSGMQRSAETVRTATVPALERQRQAALALRHLLPAALLSPTPGSWARSQSCSLSLIPAWC
jgi:hypothetical protein